MMIVAQISTRVPEKLSVDVTSGIEVHASNSKVVKDCSIIIVCVPKHKLKNVFNDIRQPYIEALKNNEVITNKNSEKP